MKRPVIKTARKGYGIKDGVRYLTIDSTKNHLKIKSTSTITLNEAR